MGGAESSLSQDVDLAMLPADDDDDDRPDKDPFIPQERIFAKYAAMLYTSDNNGRTFHELKDAKYCASCGEKVRMTSHHCTRLYSISPPPPMVFMHLDVALLCMVDPC